MNQGSGEDQNNLYSLMELNLLLAQGLEMKEMSRLVATTIPSLLDVPFVALGFREREEGKNWLVIGQCRKHPLDTTAAQELASLLARDLAQQAFSGTGSLLLGDLPPAAGAVPKPLGKLGIKSLLVAPVRTISHTFGVMMVGREVAQDYTQKQRLVASTVANQMAIALENTTLIEKWRKAEERYRSTLDGMLEGCQIIGYDWRYLYVNDAVARHGRRIKEELLGHTMMEMYPGIENTEMFARLRRCMEERTPHRMENEFTFPDDTKGWFELSIQPVPEGIFVLSIDITERKRAEEALRESEEKYRGIFNKVPTSIILLDKDGQIVDANPYHVTRIGKGKTTQKDYLGKNIVAHPSIVNAGLSETYARLLKGEAFDLKDVYFPTTTGGTDGYFNVKGVPIFKRGRVFGAIAMHEDITERKQAEKALRESEEKYRGLVTNVKLGIFRSTPEPAGRFLEVNPAMEEITGYSKEELLQMNVSDLYMHPEEREAILEEIASATGKATKDLHLRQKDGTEIVVSDTKVAVRNDNGKVIYFDGIIEDITKRKQAEEKEKQLQAELYLSSRLAAIGELAAGVAHEINNPLTGIIGFSERLLRKSSDEKARKDLKRIHSEGLRMAKVVENLLAFARRHRPKREYEDINDILQKALELRAYELKTSNIEVKTSLAPALPKIVVDFYQIQEVFLNLIINAEQAMVEASRGGKLGIKTQQMRDHIRITFTDDGPGISAEHLDKVFNPFFTTRGERGGTGLGLSVCHSIIKEHDGRIYAKSIPGKGATFFVELPLSAENMGKSQAA